MKYAVFLVLAIAAGMFGGYISQHPESLNLGAIAARTTITAPWSFTATTTMNANLTVTSTNTATSTIDAGCIQTYATSTATPHRWTISSVPSATTTVQGSNSSFFVVDQYGKCPRI